MQRRKSDPKLLIAAAALFVPMALLHDLIQPLRAQYLPKSAHANEVVTKLPIEFALGALTGFKEAIAGLLWVRADEFFHSGDYEAITPLIRFITWLDPHWIDPYETGAWHMDYNFTDVDQRSDRRYIPLSLSLLKEGIQNNPDVPEIYSDLALTHYFRKIQDYNNSVKYFEQGQAVIDQARAQDKKSFMNAEMSDGETMAESTVTITLHGLAAAYEAQGNIPAALAEWKKTEELHQFNVANNVGNPGGERTDLEVAKHKVYEMEQRVKWRARDTKVPIDVHFEAEIDRTGPKKFDISGELHMIGSKGFVLETGKASWGPADGSRVEVRIEDENYVPKELTGFGLNDLQLSPTVTILQDSISVRNGHFKKSVDMSQDPEMYSFSAPRYKVTFWFNPASPTDTPLNVQDRIGWRGEGMTDAKYLDKSGIVPGIFSGPVTGLTMIKKTMFLTREDFTGQGTKIFR